MQRHHGPLAEPDQRESRIVKCEALEFRIEEGIDCAARLDRAVPAFVGSHRIVGRPVLDARTRLDELLPHHDAVSVTPIVELLAFYQAAPPDAQQVEVDVLELGHGKRRILA